MRFKHFLDPPFTEDDDVEAVPDDRLLEVLRRLKVRLRPRNKFDGSYWATKSDIQAAQVLLSCVEDEQRNRPSEPTFGQPAKIIVHPAVFQDIVDGTRCIYTYGKAAWSEPEDAKSEREGIDQEGESE